eukprot:s1789_g11.t1
MQFVRSKYAPPHIATHHKATCCQTCQHWLVQKFKAVLLLVSTTVKRGSWRRLAIELKAKSKHLQRLCQASLQRLQKLQRLPKPNDNSQLKGNSNTNNSNVNVAS